MNYYPPPKSWNWKKWKTRLHVTCNLSLFGRQSTATANIRIHTINVLTHYLAEERERESERRRRLGGDHSSSSFFLRSVSVGFEYCVMLNVRPPQRLSLRKQFYGNSNVSIGGEANTRLCAACKNSGICVCVVCSHVHANRDKRFRRFSIIIFTCSISSSCYVCSCEWRSNKS